MRPALKDNSSSIKEQIKVDLLKGTFEPRTFVDAITSNIGQGVLVSEKVEFNAKPFVRFFESAVDELLKMRRKIQNKIDDLQDEVDATESSRMSTLKSINIYYSEIQEHFQTFEESLQNVGNAAIKVGKQLESLDKQKQRAIEAKTLIQLFQDFRSGDQDKLTEIAEKWQYDDLRTIVMAKRLAGLVKEVDLTDIEQAKFNVERFCEDLERTLLGEFDMAFKASDVQEMKRLANLLYHFNGAHSCVQMFISQTPIFVKKAYIFNPSYWNQLGDDSTVMPNRLPDPPKELVQMITDVQQSCDQEWSRIQIIFPHPKQVMQQYVQRVFAQVIQSYIEAAIPNVDDSVIRYLRLLECYHQSVRQLSEHLVEFDQRAIQSITKEIVLVDTLQRSFTDLFVMYLDNGKAFSLELEWMNDQCRVLLSSFWQKVAGRNRYFSRKGNKTSINIPAEYMQKEPTSSKDILPTPVYREFILSIENVLTLIGWNVEALNRAKELVPAHLLAERTETIWNQLLQTVAAFYVETALVISIEDFPVYDGKGEPDPTPFLYLKTVQKALKLLQIHFNKSVVPLVVKSPNLHRNMVQEKNEWIGYMEGRMNHLLKKQVEVTFQYVSSILAKQKKTEYKLKDEVTVDMPQTATCEQLSAFVIKMLNVLKEHFEGMNRSSIVLEFAMNFHRTLLDHFKKFQVSQTGGILLSKDLARYQELFADLHMPQLLPHYEMLKELGNLFVVRADTLKNVVNQGYLVKLDAGVLLPYVSMREDWTKLTRYEREIFGKRRLSTQEEAAR